MQKRKNSPQDPPSATTDPRPKDYLSQAPSGGVYLKIIIQPRAAREMVVGPYRDGLKVKVNAPPVEGAANKGLITLISKLLRVAKGNIEIKQGETSRNKLLLIKGTSLSEAQGHIDAAIDKNNR